MKILSVIAFAFFALSVRSQGDFGSGGGVRMPSGSGIMSGAAVPSVPKIIGNATIKDEPVKSTFKIGEELPKSIFDKPETFVNPNERLRDELNKKAIGDLQVASGQDMVFREIRTNSLTARIRFRDHEDPDGDMIRIYCNGVIQKYSAQLHNDFQEIELTLVRGNNELEFEALNQGLSGPNTAEFEVVDQDGTLLATHKWNLNTGFRAKIVIHKN